MRSPAASLLVAAIACAGCGTAARLFRQPPGERGEVPVLRVRWQRLLTEPPILEYKPFEFASAAASPERVFVGSHGGWFYALRRDDGALSWRKRIAGGVSGRPLYLADTGTVYVGGNDGVLYALVAATGAERWTYKAKGPVTGTPVFDEGTIYVTTGENRVYAIDAGSGAWRWQYDREAPETFTIRGVSSPLLYGGRAYVGFADGYLAALNARTGDAVWARSLAGDAQRFVDVDATPTVVDGVLYAASYAGGVYALDPADGSVKWHFPVEGAATVRADGGRVWFAATHAGLHCLDRDGHLVWRQALAEAGELSAPVLLDGALGRYLLASASEAGTYVVDAASGRLLQFFSPGHGVTAPATTDGGDVYLLTNGGWFYDLAVAM